MHNKHLRRIHFHLISLLLILNYSQITALKTARISRQQDRRGSTASPLFTGRRKPFSSGGMHVTQTLTLWAGLSGRSLHPAKPPKTDQRQDGKAGAAATEGRWRRGPRLGTRTRAASPPARCP